MLVASHFESPSIFRLTEGSSMQEYADDKFSLGQVELSVSGELPNGDVQWADGIHVWSS